MLDVATHHETWSFDTHTESIVATSAPTTNVSPIDAREEGCQNPHGEVTGRAQVAFASVSPPGRNESVLDFGVEERRDVENPVLRWRARRAFDPRGTNSDGRVSSFELITSADNGGHATRWSGDDSQYDVLDDFMSVATRMLSKDPRRSFSRSRGGTQPSESRATLRRSK